MTDDLHDVLDRTADLAGPARFDADLLWRQGTRAKRLHEAMTVVGALAVLALVSLSVWWGTSTTPPPAEPASTHVSPAMPSTLYDPTGDVPTAPDLRIGVTAAVFLPAVEPGVVAVSAVDGSYRRLVLPGFDETQARTSNVPPALAVSPDGTKLAYPWHSKLPAISGSHVASGIRVVDLRSGSVRTYRVSGQLAALCDGMAWSPDARYVVSNCELQESISDQGNVAKTGEIVRLDLRIGTVSVVPTDGWTDSLAAVNDEGQVAIVDGTVSVWTLRPHAKERVVPVYFDASNSSLGWAGDSSSFVVAGLQFSKQDGHETGMGLQVISGDGHADQVRRVGGVAGWVLGPVGSERAAVWVVRQGGGDVYLQSESGALAQSVHFEGVAPLDAFSVATTLLERPTHDTADPNALSAWDHIRAAMPYIAVGSLLLLVLLILMMLRRRERTLRLV